MNTQTPSLANLDEHALTLLLGRATRNCLILGALGFAALTIAGGWRSGALFFSGALICAASIYEWGRLVRLINARTRARAENQPAPRGAGAAIVFILLRLFVFAAAIYVSLKCFQGSPIALVCGLSLAVVTLTFEALRLLRG